MKTVRREGKAIWFDLGDEWALRIHLRMSGRLLWLTSHGTWPAYTRCCIYFRTGQLLCIDPRRFATVEIRRGGTETCEIPDALQIRDTKWLARAARGRRVSVKEFLMDQRVVAGVGNIYACEILHEASVDPRTAANVISLQRWHRIVAAMTMVLKNALRCRGTSISDWRDLHGRCGEFQYRLKVYHRGQHPCRRCGGEIQRIVLGGRGTYFCPLCQH